MTGYKRIEYIESTGSQWIDTGVKPTSNTIVKVKLCMTAVTGDVVIGHQGADTSAVDTADWRLFNYSNQFYLDINSSRLNGGSFQNGTVYELEFGNNYLKNLTTGEMILSGTTQASFSQNVTVRVFRGNSVLAKGKIYYLKVYEGGSLVRDYVPVKSEDGVYGLYDTVHQTFNPSAGSSGFSGGKEFNPPVYPFGFRRRLMSYREANKVWVQIAVPKTSDSDYRKLEFAVQPDVKVYAVATTSTSSSRPNWCTNNIFYDVPRDPSVYSTNYTCNNRYTERNLDIQRSPGDFSVLISVKHGDYSLKRILFSGYLRDDLSYDSSNPQYFTEITKYASIIVGGVEKNAYIYTFEKPMYLHKVQSAVDVENWFILVDESSLSDPRGKFQNWI